MYSGNLAEKVAIVTGGSKGIGKSIAKTLAHNGAKVAIFDRNFEEAEKVALEIGKDRSLAIKGDVTVKIDVENMIDKTLDIYGKLDIMVNNAGISTMDHFIDIKEEDWDKVMAVNAKGVFLCGQAAAKVLVEQNQGGKIINMASQAGKNGYRCMGNYCASKHAVIGLTKVMAVELAKYNIKVNAVCPGIVETDMKRIERVWGAKLRDMKPEDIRDEDFSQVPLGRTAKPQDVANVVMFLASSYSDYMTGQAINVTGGMTMN